ncbi:polysaccharide deacetylase family protein [Natrialba sp. INN-245]|uniref:polysaccharide deacetylase family protein n=1 Tax=Natrialba sp. INN-245 TaxID=2690967 RepID=UPI0013130CD1|nr:polysaccharide deacetylase family protein [Natrialba sp. INN-245]MWV40042.1 hypothetical protein [Natrialba sp. INN-245]
MLEDYEFALCLTHDVDRVYKTFQSPFYAVRDRDPSHLRSLVSSEQPYWQFEEIMELEEELGVRSSFYFLTEKDLFRDKGPRDWVKPKNWKLFAGRYDITNEELVDVIRSLDQGGWEVGLHGSYESYTDPERLQYEKETLEDIVGHEITGGRQHYLNLNEPETWEYHRKIGLQYDASLGSTSEFGFQHAHKPVRPFNDEFVVFPLTAMEVAVMDGGLEVAKKRVERLLEKAVEQHAVITVLWHPRFFNDDEFPGYRQLYRWLIRNAQKRDAWIGSCEKLYEGYLN